MKLMDLFFSMAITVLVFFLLIVGKQLLIPAVIAFIVWYLINVLISVFGRLNFRGKKLPSVVCFLAAILTIFFLLSAMFNMITDNVSEVIKVMPAYQKRFDELIVDGSKYLHLKETPTLKQILAQIDFTKILSISASALGDIAKKTGVIILYVIFLLLEQNGFSNKISALFSNAEREAFFRKILRQIDADIQAYIGIKTLISILIGAVSYLVMMSVGVDFALFWATVIFVMNYIPVVGSILGTVFPSLLALIQFDSFYPFIIVTGLICLMQFLTGNILEPRVMGNRLNLSPLVILLSLTLWGAIWGIVGMFLCVPIMVIVMIVFSHFSKTRAIAVMLSKNGKIK